jgi:hypothetical protein
MLILPRLTPWMEAAVPFSPCGAANLKNTLQKIRRVRWCLEKDDLQPNGEPENFDRPNNGPKTVAIFLKTAILNPLG